MDLAALVTQLVAVYVVGNCSRGTASTVLLEPSGSHLGWTALKDVPCIASTADIARVKRMGAELAATGYGEVEQMGMLDARPELLVVGAGGWTTTPGALESVVGVRRAGGRKRWSQRARSTVERP